MFSQLVTSVSDGVQYLIRLDRKNNSHFVDIKKQTDSQYENLFSVWQAYKNGLVQVFLQVCEINVFLAN